MITLHHWPLDPAGRMARLVLAEKGQSFTTVESAPWQPHPQIVELAPGARGPAVLHRCAEGRVSLCGTAAIAAHFEEMRTGQRLLPATLAGRAEARRLWQWCEESFACVTDTLLAERIAQAENESRPPDAEALRQGAHALRGRLTFLNALCEMRPWLAGREMSLADLSAAAHLSAYDYFGDISWTPVAALKEWYAKLKSRPSFRTLLSDRIGATCPARHYADLDF